MPKLGRPRNPNGADRCWRTVAAVYCERRHQCARRECVAHREMEPLARRVLRNELERYQGGKK